MRNFIIPDVPPEFADVRDFGTPPQKAAENVTLTIDGYEVTVPAGTSVMRAAAEADIMIPKLCSTDSLEAIGSCRVCLVEIDGRKGAPASCTTPVESGMVVHTQSELVNQLRKGVMELYVSDHPRDLLTSPTNGLNLIQEVSAAVGLREVRYGKGANHVIDHVDDGEANPLYRNTDASNPYFSFDPSLCILCFLCQRACDDIQGTFALTFEGRGFDMAMVPGQDQPFFESDCVSCGACVQVCPTGSLLEKSVAEMGTPERSVLTTCAYCGVGCQFEAQMRGDKLVRMIPYKHGKANHGHSCVKGRFAYGYANHVDRILKPMVREKITDPWREVEWDEAIGYAAKRLKEIQKKHGTDSVGVITSSRCTNEETYLVQKMARQVLRTNNTDTCGRVCHSPTGYGMNTTLGTSAGTNDFDSIEFTDVAMMIGCNPTDAHPVFGSRLRARLREGMKLIVIDPRRTDLLKTPHIGENIHLATKPGTNVAILSAIAHVIVTEGLTDQEYIHSRCDVDAWNAYAEFISDPRHSPEAVEATTRVPADLVRQAARLYASAGNGATYHGLGVTEHEQGSTAVMCIANLAMMTGNLGRPGAGMNPLRGQNNVQGSCDMGSFPNEMPGYRHISDPETRAIFEKAWGVPLPEEPGLRIPNMFDAAIDGEFMGFYIEGEDLMQSDPDTSHVAAALEAMECVIVHDLFLNETAMYAHVFLPGSTFLEKDGTFTNSERRINRVRKVTEPMNGYADWEITQMLANALGGDWNYTHPSQIMDEVALTTPSFAGVTFDLIDRMGSVQWPCNEDAPEGTPVMHVNQIKRGKGLFIETEYVASDEKTGPRFPLLLTTGRILYQYNVGAQTRRTENEAWHAEDVLEIHPHDAEERGITAGETVRIASRTGETTLRAYVTDRVAVGVVYTTFHHPGSQANVVTTDSSDWATNCPEYKVTAVQVSRTNALSDWQQHMKDTAEATRKILVAE